MSQDKPASDKQTQAERERELHARDFREHGEWATIYKGAGESRWEDRYAAAFATQEVAQAVAAEREACAKAICEECWIGIIPVVYSRKLLKYIHKDAKGELPCEAAAIHSRTEKGGK